MRSKPVIGQSSRSTSNEIAIVLAEFGAVLRAKVAEIVESRIRKIPDKIEAEGVETVVDTFENAIHTSYYYSNEGRDSAINSNAEPSLS